MQPSKKRSRDGDEGIDIESTNDTPPYFMAPTTPLTTFNFAAHQQPLAFGQFANPANLIPHLIPHPNSFGVPAYPQQMMMHASSHATEPSSWTNDANHQLNQLPIMPSFPPPQSVEEKGFDDPFREKYELQSHHRRRMYDNAVENEGKFVPRLIKEREVKVRGLVLVLCLFLKLESIKPVYCCSRVC
jgi:hypothetical protein